MINGIDYNGRRGAHPSKNGVSLCDCIKHTAERNNLNPMQIQGVNPITTPNTVIATPDVNVIVALSGNQDALNSYLATFNTPVVATPDNPNVNIPQPVNNIAIQTEYVIPLNIDASGKGMAKVTDARIHAVTKFTDGIHDLRWATAYATKAIVADGEWELVFRKKA